MRLQPGSLLGPYEISGALGAGGMGEVYRARDPRLGREVAVKVLPHGLVDDPERLARFEREARSSSALNHPNIVTIHEFAKAGDVHYLVMELIRGESLREIVSRGPLPLKKLLAMSASIAGGLAAAHAAGVVHRDLKPENVVVTADGIPKIVDFGLVKSSELAPMSSDSPTEVQVSRGGVIVGTVAYMSPEQASGAATDIQSDQFALGLIVYEMATGKHPFRRATPFETLTAIVNDPAPDLGEGFPQPLAWVVERCLAKNPAERYASTTDLARDLAALRDRASSLSTPSLPASSTARRPSRALPILVTLAVIAATILLATTIFDRRRAPARSIEPLHAVVAIPQIDVLLREVGVPVNISPNGRYIVVSGRGSRGTDDIWVHDLRSGTSRPVAENAYAPAWSPDSESVAFLADGKLKTVPVNGGPPKVVCDAPPEGTPAWSGNTIVFTRFSGGSPVAGLYAVDANGGQARRIVSAAATEGLLVLPWWPHFLPDGKRFLYTTIRMTSRERGQIFHDLMLGSLDGTAPRRIAEIDSRAIVAAGHILYVRDGTLLAQPFDAEKVRMHGEARPLVDDIHYFRSTGMAAFSVSENGTLAWHSAKRPSRLVWLDRSGAETSAIGTAIFHHSGRLSRDGTRYVVGVADPKQGTSDIWEYGLTRDNAERRTFELIDQKVPLWAPDGETIYYRSDGYGSPPDIVGLRPGADSAETIYQGRGVEEPQDFSPDGKWLLFTSFSISAADIYVLPLAPRGEPRPFVVTPFDESSPRFSPDGDWVAYTSNVAGTQEVYVRRFSGGAATRISKQGGAHPRWSRDGKELFFLGPAGRVMSVAVDGSFGEPRMLFQAQGISTFEVAPDSKRFLVHLDERGPQPSIHLLLNWPSRLSN